jgi:phosphoglucomutase
MIEVQTIKTKAYTDQKAGTSGLRKPTKSFEFQENYTENFIASILKCIEKPNSSLIIGGDGRYFMTQSQFQ